MKSLLQVTLVIVIALAVSPPASAQVKPQTTPSAEAVAEKAFNDGILEAKTQPQSHSVINQSAKKPDQEKKP